MIYKSTNGNQNTEKFFSNERKSLLFCIMKNFCLFENNTPFYDDDDQIGNNYYFDETPQGVFKNIVPDLKWWDHRTIFYNQDMNKYDTLHLIKILNIQNRMIIPQNNRYVLRNNYHIKIY